MDLRTPLPRAPVRDQTVSARSRIRRLRDERAHARARLHLSDTMRWMLGLSYRRPRGIIHPATLEQLLRCEEAEGLKLDRSRRGWNRFRGWTCQVCGRDGHVGPCRRRALEAATRGLSLVDAIA